MQRAGAFRVHAQVRVFAGLLYGEQAGEDCCVAFGGHAAVVVESGVERDAVRQQPIMSVLKDHARIMHHEKPRRSASLGFSCGSSGDPGRSTFAHQPHVAVFKARRRFFGFEVQRRFADDPVLDGASEVESGYDREIPVWLRAVGLDSEDFAARAFDQAGGRSPEQDLASRQHGQVAAGLGHVLDYVGAQEHRPVSGEVGEEVPEADAFLGVEPGGRFVHDQEPRVVQQRLGDANPTPHPAGETLELALRHILQPHDLQQFFYAVATFLLVAEPRIPM